MKRLIANSLTPVKLDDGAIQYLTDSMANGLLIQIEYQGSGWRTVQPYSFTTSKDNNLLIMCYKADGSVRSYRFDRIEQLYIDEALIQNSDVPENEDKRPNLSDFEIPYLPEYDEILELSENESGEPFQDGLDSIEEGQTFEPQPIEDENDKKESDENDEVVNDNDSEEIQDNDESTNHDDSNENHVDVDLDNEEESDEDVDVDLDNEEEGDNNEQQRE